VPFLIGKRRQFFLAIAARIVPETAALDEGARERGLLLIEDLLASRPARMRRELAMFLLLVRWLPAWRHGRPLDWLAPADQDMALAWFQNAPVALVRKGFWGVKTLVFLGYYGRPEIGETIGYRPTTNGNRRLGAAANRPGSTLT
jgi:hypothetical protein